MNELALFAGAGCGLLGTHFGLGWRTVCAVERDEWAAGVLLARQNDGILTPFPVWDDVCTFDGRPWRGIVDVVSGGFPCQDISNSGLKAGIDGERSGLWRQMARIIREVQPRVVFVENVAALLNRGIGTVLGDLAVIGFDARWGVLGTSDIGGGQPRKRLWIVAHAKGVRRGSVHKKPWVLPAEGGSCARPPRHRGSQYAADRTGILRADQSGVGRVADGFADRLDRIRVAGNGQDPRVAAAAFRILSGLD